VTRDTKEDWWWEHDGKTLGPRHELIQEMVDTNTRFYMYTTERFMEYAQTHFHLDAKPEVIEEVKYMAVSACEACGKRYGSVCVHGHVESPTDGQLMVPIRGEPADGSPSPAHAKAVPRQGELVLQGAGAGPSAL